MVSHTAKYCINERVWYNGNCFTKTCSFLCDRKQRVKIGDLYSSYASVSSGVPRASCTGPLLFILYANDLPDSHQGNETMVCLFADDTKLYRVLSRIEDRFELQEGLNDFINWADQWQLLNTSALFCPMVTATHQFII